MMSQLDNYKTEVSTAGNAVSFESNFLITFVKQNYIPLLMGLNLFLALFLRIYDLTGNPTGLNQDEAVNGVDAYSLGQTLRDHHGNFLPAMLESFEDWSSPALSYMTVPFVWVLGLSEFSIRLPMVLAGVASVFLMYLYVKNLTKRVELALLASFLLNIMPWHIISSRWAIPPNIVTFFLLIFLYVNCRVPAFESKTWKFGMVGLCAALLTYSYPTQKMFVPMLFGIFVLVDLASKVPIRQLFKKYLVTGLSFLVLTSPIYLLTLLDPARYNARFNAVSIFSLKGNVIGEFFKRYADYFKPDFTFTGLNTYVFLSPFYFIGIAGCIYALFARKPFTVSRPVALLLSGWWLASPIPASLTQDFAFLSRVIHGSPLIIIFMVFGVAVINDLLKSRFKNNLLFVPIVYMSIFIVSLYFLVVFSSSYMSEYKEVTKTIFQYGVQDFSQYLSQNEARFDNVVVDSQINQPYIYYLFFSGKDPHQYNYSEINFRKNGLDGLRGIPKLDKYTYTEITPETLKGATEIFVVRDDKNVTWYKVYARDRQWYVVSQ